MERKHYIDNIRWMTVVLVVIYHVFYIFNAVGVLGGIGNFSEVQYQDAILYLLYPWFMVLLFVLAGMSARFALDKKQDGFIKSRTVKLLVPSTLGLFVFQWILGYMNIYIGGGLDSIPGFILYPICVLSGTGPLWFAQMLWLFSVLLVLVRKIDRKDMLWSLGRKANIPVLLGLGIVVWLSNLILNVPVITVYRFGIYPVAFFLGYFVFSHEEVMERVERMKWVTLPAAVIMGIAYVIVYFGDNYAEPAILYNPFTNSYLWISVLAILGSFRAWMNRTNAFFSYMNRSNYGIYVLHYIVLMPICILLKKISMPPVAIYAIVLVAIMPLTLGLYEVMRRIPVIRFLVLGIKKQNKKVQ